MRTNARLVDRVRRRIPEPLKLWLYGIFAGNLAVRRIVMKTLTNERDSEVIRVELGRIRGGPWLGFADGIVTVGSTERVVEIPWTLSRYTAENRVLDIGTAFAIPVYVEALVNLGIADLHGADIAPYRVRGVKMVQADVRRLPYPDDHFDLVFCVSTLEHVGRGEDPFGVSIGEDPDTGDLAGLQEMSRVTRPTGRILVTVPFGIPELRPWQRQYDLAGWQALVDGAGLTMAEQHVYLYDPGSGWSRAEDPAVVTGHGYQDPGAPGATGVLCAAVARRR
jgi:SAM-dependent methyltransferase